MDDYASSSRVSSPCSNQDSAERFSSDEESASTLDGSPLEGQSYLLTNDSLVPPLSSRANEEARGNSSGHEAIILRYRGYLNVEINIRHIDIANLRDGRELSNAMVDFLLA
ncbi:hypothetical protein FS837_012808 [Tulasnella sp. UAMH 9824]|nr:hypothetical protein FS837_012808 [Tulasnella sp. UAMH 9824]